MRLSLKMYIFYIVSGLLLMKVMVSGVTLRHEELHHSGDWKSAKTSEFKFQHGQSKPQALYHNCPPGFRGTLSHPGHCDWFINCWDGIEHQQPCRQNLIYNAETRRCDFPEKANCCEYRELDSSKLVE